MMGWWLRFLLILRPTQHGSARVGARVELGNQCRLLVVYRRKKSIRMTSLKCYNWCCTLSGASECTVMPVKNENVSRGTMRCMCHAAQCAAFTGNLHNIGAWFGCNTNPGHKVPIITTCYQAVVLSCWHNGQSVNISQYNIPSCHLTRIPVMNLLADIMRANNSDVR